MTEEAIKSFVEKLSTDETFANKLASAATPEERLKIANDAGFAVSASDLSAIKAALSVEELSDEDLEKVAGHRCHRRSRRRYRLRHRHRHRRRRRCRIYLIGRQQWPTLDRIDHP